MTPRFSKLVGDEEAGPSTPLKNASLRMTVLYFFISG
jgi:hypothetical protein